MPAVAFHTLLLLIEILNVNFCPAVTSSTLRLEPPMLFMLKKLMLFDYPVQPLFYWFDISDENDRLAIHSHCARQI